MVIDKEIIASLSQFSEDEIESAYKVFKWVSYCMFMKLRSPDLDKVMTRATKAKLDALCDVLSHIELHLKKKEYRNDEQV